MNISNIHICLNFLKVQLKVYTLKNLEVAGMIFFTSTPYLLYTRFQVKVCEFFFLFCPCSRIISSYSLGVISSFHLNLNPCEIFNM